MGRWFEQQGVFPSLFSTRRSRHPPMALHLPRQVTRSSAWFLTPSWQTLHVLPLHSVTECSPWLCGLQKSSSECGIKTCLHFRVCSSLTSPKMGVTEVSVYCWQKWLHFWSWGSFTFNCFVPGGWWWLVLTLPPLAECGAFIHLVLAIVPATSFKYPQWDTHAQIFCRNSWVTASYDNLSVTMCKWKTQEARFSLNLSKLCREPVLLLCSPPSSAYSNGHLAWAHERHVKSLWILTVPMLRIDDSFFSFSILWIT